MIDLSLIFNNTLTGVLTNLPWFLLVIWAVRKISRDMPFWIKQYHENHIKELVLEKAVRK